MTVLRTINGNLIFTPETNGLMTTQSANDPCCCEESPTCCYNANCEIVDCDSPDAIGDVQGCNPCRINFCGFCPPNIPVEQPINHIVNPGDPGIRERLPLCISVEPEAFLVEVNIGASLTSGSGTGFIGDLVRSNSDGNSVWSVAVRDVAGGFFLDSTTGIAFFRFQMLARIGNISAQPIIIEQLQAIPSSFNGVSFEFEASLELTNLTLGEKNSDCESEATATFEYFWRLIVTDNQTGQELLNETIPDNQRTATATTTIDLSGCGGEVVRLSEWRVRRLVDTFGQIVLTSVDEPFVQTLPTCAS